MAKLNPYLTFDGTARAAIEFYAAVFGGHVKVTTFDEFGDAGNHGVMHAQLDTLEGFTLMASDLPPGGGDDHVVGTNVAVSLSGMEADLLREYWHRLSSGATVTLPLERQMWGDEFGMLIDRFGVHWMVNIAAAPAAAAP